GDYRPTVAGIRDEITVSFKLVGLNDDFLRVLLCPENKENGHDKRQHELGEQYAKHGSQVEAHSYFHRERTPAGTGFRRSGTSSAVYISRVSAADDRSTNYSGHDRHRDCRRGLFDLPGHHDRRNA